jgi:hypothetical protein
MKYIKTYESTAPKFKKGDYVKYLYDLIDIYTLTDEDFFIITNVNIDIHDNYYKLTKIDRNYNFTPIDNLGINEQNIELYHPTEKQKNEIEIKLNQDKYNL